MSLHDPIQLDGKDIAMVSSYKIISYHESGRNRIEATLVFFPEPGTRADEFVENIRLKAEYKKEE